LLGLVIYIVMFLMVNSMRMLKPYDNHLLFNPIKMVTETIKDLRS
jgi:hypothetical protein